MKTLEDYYKQTEIDSEKDNDEALKLMESLVFGEDKVSPEKEKMLAHLLDIIEAFEEIHYPIGNT